jgi:hypothetical protein
MKGKMNYLLLEVREGILPLCKYAINLLLCIRDIVPLL